MRARGYIGAALEACGYEKPIARARAHTQETYHLTVFEKALFVSSVKHTSSTQTSLPEPLFSHCFLIFPKKGKERRRLQNPGDNECDDCPETKIPKIGFEIWFYFPPIEGVDSDNYQAGETNGNESEQCSDRA